jgi:phospholipase/carboxylesterase
MTDGIAAMTVGNWQLRVRIPQDAGAHPALVMLHGWTGDENAMWVFGAQLPPRYLLLAPRAPYPAPMGGYSWYARQASAWPALEDFRPAVEGILDLLRQLNFPGADFSSFHLLGFSQGAALSYALALLYPARVLSVAALAGFMPTEAASLVGAQPLRGKPVYVAHGVRDAMVPVEQARLAVDLLQAAGAEVSYCETDVGHKLSVSCFKDLKAFFA